MEILDVFPLPSFTTRFLWEAAVDIGERQDLGSGPTGARGIIPILGGRFRGGPGLEDFSGVILPGGADRQLLRPDGTKELDALYEMQVDDGTILTVRNRVLIDESRPGQRYCLSRIHVVAPQGPWDWLNRRIILGTLQSAKPTHDVVIIRGWEADAQIPE